MLIGIFPPSFMHFLAVIGLGFVINNAPRQEASTMWTNACTVTNGDIKYFYQQRHYILYHYLVFCLPALNLTNHLYLRKQVDA